MHLQPGMIFAGEFRIVRLLGEGGMGAVYVAEQRSTGKLRALKTMHRALAARPDLRERFVQEAHVGARIESEHIVDVVAAGVDAMTGMPWLAMELLKGQTVADGVSGGFLRERSLATQAVLQLGEALASAHAAGVVHRDLKPENLYLAATKHQDVAFVLKVLDFGIAKLVTEGASRTTDSVGTPLWMAPEQTEAFAAITPATDVWAFGLLVFYLLTGRSYWITMVQGREISPAELLRQLVVDPLPPAGVRAGAAPLPFGFDRWFARCVARRPEHRFADAAEALASLRPLLGASSLELAVTAPPMCSKTPMPLGSAETHGGVSSSRYGVPRAGIHKWLGLGAFVTVVVVLLGWLATSRASAPPEVVAVARGAHHVEEPERAASVEATSPRNGQTFAAAPVELSWKNASTVVSYEVEVRRFDDEKSVVGTTPPGVAYIVWPWEGAAKPGTYRWRVRVVEGKWSEWSVWSYYPSSTFRIEDTKTLRVAMEMTYHAPFVTYDRATKQVVGFDVELADAIGEELGVKIERRPSDWSGLFKAIEARDADIVLSAVSITSERSKRFGFSRPYLRTGIVVATRQGAERIVLPGVGRSLAVQRETTAATVASKLFGRAKVRETDTLDAGFAALARGDVDGVLADEAIVRSRPEVRTGAFKADTTRLTKDAYGVMLPLGDDRLRARIDAALEALERSGKLGEMRARYGLSSS